MFKQLKGFFSGSTGLELDASGQATDHELKIATGVLLLEMAGSDDDYDPAEVQAIFNAMKSQFGVNEDASMDILEAADAMREKAGKIDEFVDAINQNFSLKQKQIVMSMIWKVVMADGKIDKYEKRFATQMMNRLQLTKEQTAEAMRMAHQ